MYVSRLTVTNFRAFGEGDEALVLPLRPGLTALVGENESGKTAAIDALRFALGTTDQEWCRLEDTDFHGGNLSKDIAIVCKFEALTEVDLRTFPEFLTYEGSEHTPVLYVNWTAKDTGTLWRGRPYREVDVRSGKDGSGPAIPSDVRDMLRATYLRPLRDAEQALSAGRGSRLSQILQQTSQIRDVGVPYDPGAATDPKSLNVLGIGDFANDLLQKQKGVVEAREAVDKRLKSLSLKREVLKAQIGVSGASASDETRLRHLLEKLDLGVGGVGELGLGSNNLLFIACELLLLSEEDVGNRMLLIEEPEAHLDTQRQLQLMSSLQNQAGEKGVQVVVTTHSPNLASTIPLDNMIMLRDGAAFSLSSGETELDLSDYRFLERFLDVTKANLFFARGVVIVEGDAENILLPTLATLIGLDFTKYGVSIVNVGGVGLRRYAKIFQRRGGEGGGSPRELRIPVACITDMDVMPSCGGEITGKSLQTKDDLGPVGLADRRRRLEERASGQWVRTFVSDEWTLEYDLALSGLAEEVYVAARLAQKAESAGSLDRSAESASAKTDFASLKETIEQEAADAGSCSKAEILASHVYALFTKGAKASKAAASQYLAQCLEQKIADGELSEESLRGALPKYVVEAIEYVTTPLVTSVAPTHSVPDDA